MSAKKKLGYLCLSSFCTGSSFTGIIWAALRADALGVGINAVGIGVGAVAMYINFSLATEA